MVRNYRMDNIKCFMILGIVLEHSLLIYGYPRDFELFWAMAISWLMPLFTMISGYFFKEKPRSVLIEKYIYPMMLFSAVNFIVGYFFYSSYQNGIHIVGYAMWYLLALFVYTVITPPILRKISLKRLLIISFIFVLLYQLLPFTFANYYVNLLQINRIVSFYPLFLIGFWLKANYTKIIQKFTLLQARMLLGCIMSFYLLCCWHFHGLAYKSGFYIEMGTTTLHILFFFMNYVFVSLIAILIIFSTPNIKFRFTHYGERTMSVYLLHMLIVFPLCYGLFSKMSFNILTLLTNCMLSVLLCSFFFSNVINDKMQTILNSIKWNVCFLAFGFALILVNNHVLLKIIEIL